MYSVRGFNLVTVASGAHDAIQQILERQHATSRNLWLASGAPDWDAAQPYTVLITPGGHIVYQSRGTMDMLNLRRTILASMDWEYEGFARYWASQ